MPCDGEGRAAAGELFWGGADRVQRFAPVWSSRPAVAVDRWCARDDRLERDVHVHTLLCMRMLHVGVSLFSPCVGVAYGNAAVGMRAVGARVRCRWHRAFQTASLACPLPVYGLP